MKQLLPCILLWCCTKVLSAQNLVPNPSFECGQNFCGPFQVPEIQNFSFYACGWSVPGIGTSDVFSNKSSPVCYTYTASSDSYSLGRQRPRTGDRYAGIVSGSKELSGDTAFSYREYLQVKLTKTLKVGGTYCAEMYASPADYQKFYGNNLGMRFNVNSTAVGNSAFINQRPQIESKTVITDTTKWTRIYGTFRATEPADYLVVGNFNSDNRTQYILNPNPLFQRNTLTYHYIEDVRVERMPEAEFTVTGNTLLCEGQPLQLKASAGVEEVIWTTLQDTTKVLTTKETFTLDKLAASTAFRVKSSGCFKTVMDTIVVNIVPLPKFSLGKDSTLCVGQAVVLKPGSFASYRWQDQSTLSQFTVTQSGDYYVRVTDKNGCMASDTVSVKFINQPSIRLGADTLMCSGFITARASKENYEYLWQDGSIKPTFEIRKSGTYWVRARNKCGTNYDSLRVFALGDVFMPNVITANGDLLNEKFEVGVKNGDEIKPFTDFPMMLEVFNRWGERVFESTRSGYHNDWPVTAESIDAGVYFFKLTPTGCREVKGWVQVIK